MKVIVETYNEIIGYHFWEKAPKEVEFLKYNHRHRFEIRCSFEVIDDDREVEIFMKERDIENYLTKKYGKEMQLKGMSCEMLAKEIINQFQCVSCQVLEDGKGGAYVRTKY